MKKFSLLFLLIFATSTFVNVNAQENRTLSNGFSIKVILGVPSASFGTDQPVSVSSRYSLLTGIQIGNQWYISPAENFGFGIMANWFDFSYAGNDNRATFDLSVLEIGPIGTYALSEEMAIDAYYNLRPTAILNFVTWSDKYGSGSNSWEGFGLTNAIGAGFRWRVLSGGLEFVFGNVKDEISPLDSYDSEIMKANSFRFLLGVKF